MKAIFYDGGCGEASQVHLTAEQYDHIVEHVQIMDDDTFMANDELDQMSYEEFVATKLVDFDEYYSGRYTKEADDEHSSFRKDRPWMTHYVPIALKYWASEPEEKQAKRWERFNRWHKRYPGL